MVGIKAIKPPPRWTRHLYAVVLILIGWVLFAFEELPLVIGYLQAMLGFNGQPLWNNTTLYFTYTNAILLVVLTFASTPVKISKRIDSRSVPALVWYGVLFFLSVAYLVDATFNPFLYFRF